MKAIILAAGSGARMRPLTDSQPKAMLKIAGQTVIERMIRSLLSRGISQICVVTGHCREQLEAHLCTLFPDNRFTFVFNHAFDRTNNIFSMHLAFEHFEINDDLLLIESDLVFTDAVLDRILDCQQRNVALVDRFKGGMDGTVVTVHDGLITNIIPPHLQGPGFNFADKFKTLNIYKFSRDFAQTGFRKLLSFYATTYNDNCYYELVLGMLVYMRQEQIHAADVAGHLWCELDDPNDVRLAEMAFNEETRLNALDSACGGFWSVPIVDFAFIRNMYFPTNSMLSDLRFNLPSLLQNYGSTQASLNRKLAYFLVVPEERLCLLNGLSQAFPMLRDMLAERSVLIPQPTFGEYSRSFPGAASYADMPGEQSIANIPTKKIADAEVVVFVNPNNPTGSFFPSEEIMELARQQPTKLILVDESFIEFSGRPSVQELLQREGLANVWVLKSLSKSLGIPGMRVGYIYSRDEAAIHRLNEQVPVWNSNSLVEYFLESVLKHRRALTESFHATMADRAAFATELAELEVVDRVYPSAANFLLVRLKLTPAQFHTLRHTLLCRWELFVKDCSNRFHDGQAYARIAVRVPEENSRLVRALIAETSSLNRPVPTPTARAA